MIKLLKKHNSLYIFLLSIIILGHIFGYLYYEFQTTEDKETINEKINIETTIKDKNTNIIFTIKYILIILISAFLIIPEIYTIYNLFYESFKIGFIFNIISHFNMIMSLKYIIIYEIIPELFFIILIRISFTINYNILKHLYKKDRKSSIIIENSLKKYTIITILLLIYSITLYIFSFKINNYLITLM